MAIPAALVLAGQCAVAGAVPPPNEPSSFAIRNARLVPVSSAVIEEGTIVIGNGLIEAIGTDVPVPADAWVIEGQGLNVYPGLIDALTDLGLPTPGETGDGAGPSRRAEPGISARGPEDRPATTPWINAADRLSAADLRLEDWLEMGFTSAVTVPSEGVFPGRAALINLAGERPGEMVVKTPLALRLSLERQRGRGFPNSLMGVLAYIKQVFLDAEHHAQAWRLYEGQPQGRERPAYDRSLVPLHEAVAERLPVLIPGHWAKEIERALRLGEALSVNTVVYGAHQGHAAAESLAAREAPVLVSLAWPERSPTADPEEEEPLRVLRFRDRAPTTPAALHREGVRFAFYSDGLANPRQMLRNARRAIDAGLPEEGAIRAFTLAAAEIFGAADRLGSLEVGKIANLVVTEGDLFAEGTRVRTVFIDGRKYEVREAGRPKAPPEVDPSGVWTLEVDTPRGPREVTVGLEMGKDGSLTGSVTGPEGTSPIRSGWVSGSSVSFTVHRAFGTRTLEATYTGTVEGESFAGTVSAGSRVGEFSGTRTSGPPELSAEPAQERGPPIASPGRPRERASPPPEVAAIRNATILTVTEGKIGKGSILIRDGKIVAVGEEVQIPEGAVVIEASGQYVMPGIIDAHSHIAVDSGINEGSVAVSAMVGIKDVLNPDDINIYRGVAGGVTAANILHGSANPIGGKNAVIKLRWGANAQGLLLDGAPPGIKFALGENPKRSNLPPRPGTPRRYPATRMGVMDVIRQAFIEAQEYRKEWNKYEERRARKEKALLPPRRDLKLEALVEVLEGKRLVHAHCYRADEILQLLRLAEEFGFRVATFQHVLEGYKVADEISAHGAAASTFSDRWAYKVEAYDAIPYNAALLTEKGVVVSMNSDSAEEMRHLNQEAAKAMKWGGLSETEALKLVTLNPAIQLGIDRWVGSIEVGKDADLVIYDRHPLSVYAEVQTTLIDGRVYFDRQEDLGRRIRLEEEKRRLLEKAGGTRGKRGGEPEKPGVSASGVGR